MAISMLMWGVLALIITLAAVAILVYLNNKKKGIKHQVNYNAIFILGIVFFVTGLVSNNPAIWSLGLVFIAVGLVNRKK